MTTFFYLPSSKNPFFHVDASNFEEAEMCLKTQLNRLFPEEPPNKILCRYVDETGKPTECELILDWVLFNPNTL